MSIEITDNKVTLDYTKRDLEGYVARLSLGLLIHDPNSFGPEEAQRINTFLDNFNENVGEDVEVIAKALGEAEALDLDELEKNNEGC